MKRDWNLIRAVLLAAAGEEAALGLWSEEQVSEHVHLAHEAGFVEASQRWTGTTFRWTIDRLAFGGHELLDQIRDPGEWNWICATMVERNLPKVLPVILKLAEAAPSRMASQCCSAQPEATP